MRYLTLALIFAFLCSCGGSSPVRSRCDGSCGAMQLSVKGSKSFNPNVEHGRIVAYRVTITGDGMDEPVVAEFDGQATEGTIDGVPAGSGRRIAVEAVNPNGASIREGEAANVQVEGGRTADVEVSLESVPIFTNIADGNNVENTRLIFGIFAEPSGQVVIEETTNAAASILADAATNENEVALDVATGLGRFAPAMQSVGVKTYQVRNTATGRRSIVTVNLTDGSKRRGAPFLAGGDNSSPDARRRVSCGTH